MTIRIATATGTQADIEAVLEKRGYEVEKPAETQTETPEEPKRDDFETDEEHEAAVAEFAQKQEEAAEAAAETEETEEAAAPQRKPSKFQKRIQKITGKLERENADLKARLEAVEKGGKKEAQPAKEDNPRPVRTSFKSVEDYEDALLAWGTAKAVAEREVAATENAQRAQLEENWNHYKSNVEAFKEANDDWDEVTNRTDIPMHQGVQLAIMEQENGAAVVYHLGKHPEYAKKLAEMSPLSAVMEVGRLSAKLAAASGSAGPAAGSGANHKPKPRVPAPVRPVSSAATTSTLTPATAAKKGDFRAFVAARTSGR